MVLCCMLPALFFLTQNARKLLAKAAEAPSWTPLGSLRVTMIPDSLVVWGGGQAHPSPRSLWRLDYVALDLCAFGASILFH